MLLVLTSTLKFSPTSPNSLLLRELFFPSSSIHIILLNQLRIQRPINLLILCKTIGPITYKINNKNNYICWVQAWIKKPENLERIRKERMREKMKVNWIFWYWPPLENRSSLLYITNLSTGNIQQKNNRTVWENKKQTHIPTQNDRYTNEKSDRQSKSHV